MRRRRWAPTRPESDDLKPACQVAFAEQKHARSACTLCTNLWVYKKVRSMHGTWSGPIVHNSGADECDDVCEGVWLAESFVGFGHKEIVFLCRQDRRQFVVCRGWPQDNCPILSSPSGLWLQYLFELLELLLVSSCD